MNRSHHQTRRYSVENKSMMDHDIHATPNFKSSCVFDRSFDTNQDVVEQLWDLPNPHKSFDLSNHIIKNKTPSKPQSSRRAMSTKRNRSNEPAIHETLQQPSTAVDSQRKSLRSSISFRSTVVPGSTARTSEIANSQSQSRMNSVRENNKPVIALVPIIDASKKKKEIRSMSGRESVRDAKESTEEHYKMNNSIFEVGSLNDRSHELFIKYKNSLVAYEDLSMRNQQVEESLRMEVLRGEEQRAYIEILRNKLEVCEKKMGSQIAMEMEATQRENERRFERARLFQDISGLNNEIDVIRDSEHRLKDELEACHERINEVMIEKEMLENHISHFQKTSSDLDKEVKKLADALYIANKECIRLQEENKSLIRKAEENKAIRVEKMESEALKQRVQDITRNYEDLKILNEETDKQRRIIANALQEEGELRVRLEMENEDITRDKNVAIARLEAIVSQKSKVAEEYQQKFEILTENYGILRITLNETEAELQNLKEVIETTEKMNKVNIEEEVQSLKESQKELIFSLEQAEDLKARALRDKEIVERELDIKTKEIERLKTDVESMRVNTRQIIKEYEGWEREKMKLLNKIQSLGGEVSRVERDTSMISDEGIEDIVKKHENRERLIKTLKDQVSILEKENILLKNSQQSGSSKIRPDQLKEENNILQKKNEFLIKKLHEIVEAQNQAQSNNTQLKDRIHIMKRVFVKVERELNEIIDNSPLNQDLEAMGNDTLRGLAYQEGDEEKDWNRLEILVKRVKKELSKLNERYTQAKMDLVNQMERCEDIVNESFRANDNHILKEKVQKLNAELVDASQENSFLKRSNDNLNKKLVLASGQVQSLKNEVEVLKNKENNALLYNNVAKDSHGNSDLKLKEAMIRRLSAFIFNSDVKEIVDEIMSLENHIIKADKSKNKHSLRNGSLASLSTNANEHVYSQSQTCSTSKDEHAEVDETVDMQKARKDILEMELNKLEAEERKRYDSIDLIEKQNFELKNELSRLMNGLEINFSEYRDNKSEYFSKRMDERFTFSNGYDLTMSELENKKYRNDMIQHHEHSIEKFIEDDGAEDHYYS